MEWNFDETRPIYLQLAEKLEERIVSGKIPPGGRLRTVRELAQEVQANPNTVQRALSELERWGLVQSHRTSGRFVTEDAERIRRARDELADARIREFLASMKELGISEEELKAMLAERRGM